MCWAMRRYDDTLFNVELHLPRTVLLCATISRCHGDIVMMFSETSGGGAAALVLGEATTHSSLGERVASGNDLLRS